MKLALAFLVPCAVMLAVLAEFFSRAIFGPDLVTAAGPLRILSLAVPLYGVFYLSNSLIVSRLGATAMAVIAAGMVAVNVVLNLLLVPEWREHGAAVAMLATEVLAVPVVVAIAARAVGGIRLFRTLGGPLIAGAAMAGAMLALGSPWPALGGGMFVYAATLIAVERMVAPEDLRLVVAIVRRPPATGREPR